MLVKDTEAECRNDLELYCTLVDKGRIYRYFADELYKATGVFYDLNVPREKRKLKDEFFLMLYSDNRFIYYEKGYQKRVFKRLFRTVHRIFNLIKQQDKTVLPILLQQVESEVVLKRVCRRLSGLYPELPIFTIHDSIVTLESHKWIVRDTLKMEFENTTGLQPSLAFEVLSPARKITTGP